LLINRATVSPHTFVRADVSNPRAADIELQGLANVQVDGFDPDHAVPYDSPPPQPKRLTARNPERR
jgi:hypothetical protein